ncbi:glycosyltransferase family 2 protein [Saccharicrinis sp. FJH2]|uniref:glycosyltransferase family 2 protein n=1 Tax=unclassified Saccharicrinis TaxID=2646859 RepID=UPI0035D3E706
MKLSVIIVNYNARYFLDLCLQSVKRAMQGIDTEVIVVDNASTDTSVSMVKEKFPWVNLIENKENCGFSKANNIAIKKAKGQFVLLQNPDTIVAEDTYEQCLLYLDENDYVGALGIRMVDGSGEYLRESKRGLPTPMTAIFRAAGLSYIFPKSKIFARYYVGHLVNNRNAEVPILAGAFMMIRKTALDTCGLLDEDYFMYGEDIDLSYRIDRGGFTNSYFGLASIIHFKGESTSKQSDKYLNSFFGAMEIFYQKHFSGSMSVWINGLIHWGIKTKKVLKKLIIRRSEPVSSELPKSLVICGGSPGEIELIKNTFSKDHTFEEVQSVDGLKLKDEGKGIIFSPRLAYKDVINWVSNNATKAKFFFMSGDRSFILDSPNKDFPGKVWQLKDTES